MRFKVISLLVGVLISLTASAIEKLTEYTSYYGPFERIEISDNVNVIYQCMPDSAGYMRFRGLSRFGNAFIVSNNKGKLKIQVNTEDVNDPELPTVFVYSNFLSEIKNSSDKTVTVLSIAPCPNLQVKQIGNGAVTVNGVNSDRVKAAIETGNGQIVLSGKTTDANLIMVGTGTIQADLLQAEVVKCKVMGSGTVGCWAESMLNVRGLGATKIFYRGDPIVKKGPGLKVMPLAEMLEKESKTMVTNSEPTTLPADYGPGQERDSY